MNSTPTFFIHGRKIVGFGANTCNEDVKAIVENYMSPVISGLLSAVAKPLGFSPGNRIEKRGCSRSSHPRPVRGDYVRNQLILLLIRTLRRLRSSRWRNRITSFVVVIVVRGMIRVGVG